MPNVRIDVDYYDEEEKNLIRSNYPKDFAKIDPKIGVMNLPLQDIQAYALFRHQLDSPGIRTFEDLLPSAERCWIGELSFYIAEENGSLVSKYPGSIDAMNIPETIGVGSGLSVFGALYNLHQADWKRIPRMGKKGADFRIASPIPGRGLSVELKGSFVEDNNLKTSTISNHRASIKDKKAEHEGGTNTTNLGSIVAVSKQGQTLKCWLLDPPGDDVDIYEEKDRLLARLYYYTEVVSWITARSVWLPVLLNRIKAIEKSTQYLELNNVTLVDRNSNPLEITSGYVTTKAHVLEARLGGRTRLHEDNICGAMGVAQNGNLWFAGLSITAIQMLFNQDFGQIMKYQKTSERFPGILRVRIRSKDFQRMNEQVQKRIDPKSNLNWAEGENHWIEIETYFNSASSGLVFAHIT